MVTAVCRRSCGWIASLACALMFMAPACCLGADSDLLPGSSAPSPRPEAHHAIYVEANSALISASLGLNYEYRFVRGFSLSGGLGAGYAFGGFVVGGPGAQVLAHGLFGGASSHSFEAALGAAVLGGKQPVVMPATFLGYRFQPLDGGALFRLGAGWSFVAGFGLSLSGGWAF